MTQQEFVKVIKDNFEDIDSNFFNQIEKYKVFLQKYNLNINLTRLDHEDKIYGEYFYESVIPFTKVDLKKAVSILDIGSGSGIPGIVLKLLYPSLQLTIIEANGKKVKFLVELTRHLGINANIINKRAEEIEEHEYETFDLVTSRAVATLNAIIEVSLPYVKVNGLLLEPKSQNYLNEMKDTDILIKNLGGTLDKIHNFISFNKFTHNVIVIRKTQKTNHRYPRA
jgi:16S rRNA (guanine527-N7)-methyltransferase